MKEKGYQRRNAECHPFLLTGAKPIKVEGDLTMNRHPRPIAILSVLVDRSRMQLFHVPLRIA